MNLDKAREAYEHDPQYHHLEDLLVNQIEALALSPSEIREAAMFACIILEARSQYFMGILNREELEKLRGVYSSEDYRKFVLGDWGQEVEP